MARNNPRNKTGTLTQEQLQALGCIGKDMPTVTSAPPPTFPTLMTKPISSDISAAQHYRILWKEDFLNHMRDSPYFLMPKSTNKNFENYTEQYDASLLESTIQAANKLELPIPLLPLELKLNGKRKKRQRKEAIKKIKTETVEETLVKLEQKEKFEDINADIKEEDKSDSELDEQEIEMEDDEMDEDNDYGNNYFDNGEAFNEEDDNLDDGPVY